MIPNGRTEARIWLGIILLFACERAKRTLSSSTQATIEIDALLGGNDFWRFLAFSKAWLKELNMNYFRGAVERCLCDGGIDMRSAHDVVHVRGFHSKEQIHQSRRSARFFFFVAGRHVAVHGVEDSWWCDGEADRS